MGQLRTATWQNARGNDDGPEAGWAEKEKRTFSIAEDLIGKEEVYSFSPLENRDEKLTTSHQSQHCPPKIFLDIQAQKRTACVWWVCLSSQDDLASGQMTHIETRKSNLWIQCHVDSRGPGSTQQHYCTTPAKRHQNAQCSNSFYLFFFFFCSEIIADWSEAALFPLFSACSLFCFWLNSRSVITFTAQKLVRWGKAP